MKTSSIVILSLIVAFMTGCSDTATSVRLEIVAAPSLSIDGLVVTIHGARHEKPMTESLQLLVPDDWAGIAQRIEVEGTNDGAAVAVGAIVVTPIAGSEVTATVTLVDASCELLCNIGDAQCDADGVATCELGGDGCPHWSAPTACPVDAPFCSNGTCSTTCNDECSTGESMCAGAGNVRTCGEADSDSCLDWSGPTSCPGGEVCAGNACEAAFLVTVTKTGPGSGTVTSSPTGIVCGAQCSESYAAGTEVTLTATPGAGATFAGWSGGGCSGTGTCVVIVSEAIAVTATFAGTCSNGCDRADLIIPMSGLSVGLSTGTAFATPVPWHQQVFDYQFGDVNGDGRDDLIVYDEDHGTDVALSTGTSFGTLSLWVTWGYYDQAVGDVNGDGRADLVISVDGKTVVGLSTGTSFATPTQWQSPVGTPSAEDVNGDGRADLLLHTFNGTDVYLSTGTTFGSGTRWLSEQNRQREQRAADVNGDGMADIIVGAPSGTWVGLSTGTTFGTLSLWHGAPNDTRPVVGDVNGDGKADLVMPAPTGIYVGLSNGTTFGGLTQWTSATSTALAVGNVDGN